MQYVRTNKEAWEEAFEKHQAGYRDKPIADGLDSEFAYLNADLVNELESAGFKNKDIAQFCCNNGREILSVVKAGAKSGTGFDIAENFIGEAKRLAALKKINCDFVCTDILDIGGEYREKYDLVFCTIGCICWFRDLNEFFSKVSLVLKPDGIFLKSEMHPFGNVVAMEDEDEYDKDHPDKAVFSYFKDDAWTGNKGIDYVGNTKYESKTFTSFSHTFSAILNAMIANKLRIVKVNEYNHSLHGFSALEGGKLPLSMIIVGKKSGV